MNSHPYDLRRRLTSLIEEHKFDHDKPYGAVFPGWAVPEGSPLDEYILRHTEYRARYRPKSGWWYYKGA